MNGSKNKMNILERDSARSRPRKKLNCKTTKMPVGVQCLVSFAVDVRPHAQFADSRQRLVFHIRKYRIILYTVTHVLCPRG